MRGNVFMGLVLLVIGLLFFVIGMRKRGAQFLAELQRQK